MEIREVLSFYHSRVKLYVTLQELLAKNRRSLIRDMQKITSNQKRVLSLI